MATESLTDVRPRTVVILPAMPAVAVVCTLCLAALILASARGGPPLALSTPSAPPAAAERESDPENRNLEIRVVDRQTRAPIEGVEVTVETDTGARDGFGGDPQLLARPMTKQDGFCRIEFPRVLPKRIYVAARKHGYAIRNYAPLEETGGRALPRTHEMKLERGITIGGFVKRRDGRPINGATVIIMSRAGADASPDYSYVPFEEVTTDVEGRWTYNAMPTGWNFVYLRVLHPDFVPTDMQRNRPRPSDLEFKARKSQTILDEGISVSGRVLDDQGRPLAGATVGLGADRQIMNREYPKVATDAEGRFKFGHIPPGTQTMTAQAPGRAPELADVVLEAGMKHVEFRLGPGQTLRGRVVDRDGKPLEGVTVQAMNWKAHMSLDWKTKTDAEGRFTWDSAPSEPVLLTLTKPGYIMLGQREFRAGKGETQVTMYPPLRIRGKVVDARSGQPVPRFTVVDGNYYRFGNRDGKLDQVNWQRGGTERRFANGQYETEYSHPQVAAVAVRIEAEGYKPTTSEPFKLEAGDVTFDARLEPGAGPSGVVHGPDDRPLAGATVVLSTRALRTALQRQVP